MYKVRLMKSWTSELDLRKPTMRADFSLKRALIQRELWPVMKKNVLGAMVG